MAPKPGPTIEERKERKRIQNRRNQRARRDRIRCHKIGNRPERPFHIQRWRQFDEEARTTLTGIENHSKKPDRPTGDTQQSLVAIAAPITHQDRNDISSRVPPPIDHLLLHLVSYNVCRGISSNKTTLEALTSHLLVHQPPASRAFTTACGFAVIRPTHQDMPLNLFPTQLQMNEPHPTWMDFFPFPEIRNNLIRRQSTFDHMSFLEDLIGDRSYLRHAARTVPDQTAVDSTGPPGEHGLILWGEPYLKESWEATPHFLAKWAWAFEGCREIYESTDRWRGSRGLLPAWGEVRTDIF